jgi:hypothetical protein
MARTSRETSLGAPSRRLLVAAALAALSVVVGCAHGKHGAPPTTSDVKPSCYPRGVCSGFVYTCWRRCDDVNPCPVDVPVLPDGERVPLPHDGELMLPNGPSPNEYETDQSPEMSGDGAPIPEYEQEPD